MTASGESTEATQAVAVDSAVAPTHALETVGTKIGRYVVLGAAGQGGMGLVLRAYDAKLQREVALKVVRTERITPDARARMIREARAMAQLSHPNVIAIYDVEEMDRAGVVVAMEYVPGQTLREWIEGDHPWTEIVARFVAAGRGVEAAHRAGILHRDFKPANVLLGDDDRVRVMDFGLARSEQLLSDDEASDPDPERASSLEHDDPAALARELTQAGLVLGTPLYMAPEQHTGGQLTAATDQYAFCVSLWQGLAGTVPFAGKGVELLDRKLAGEPVFPKHRRAPAALIRALQRGLEPGPADRFPTMAALLDAISIDPAAKRSRRLIVASIAAVVAGVGAAATMATSQPRPCTRAEQSLGDVWSAARREATAKAFEDLAAQYAAVAWTRIAPRLDTYAADWVAEHTDACEATHVRLEQSERTLDLRMACLATAKRDLAAAVEVLADADDDVAAHADRIVDGLPAIDACRSVPPPGRSGASRAQSGAESDAASSPELDGALARSAALRRAGRYDAAWDAVTQAEALLRDVDAPRRAAAARLERGIIQSERGKYPGARDDLTAAMRAAIELDDPRMAGRAGHWLVHTVGLLQDEPEAAALTGQLALGFAARSGDRQLEAQVRVVNANLAAKARRFDEAEAGLRAVIAMHEAEPGQPVAARAAAFQGLGNVLLTVHEPAAAEAAFRSAIELGTELGADHPSVLVGRLGLASAVKAAGDAAAAEVILREVAALQIAALGEYHPDVALTYHNLGNALLDGAKLRDAEAAYRSALAIRVATIGPEANETSSTRTSLGNVLRAQNKLEEAAAVLRETIAILHETRGPASLEVAYAQGNLASVLRMAGDTPGAETTIRAALSTMRTKLGDDHPHVATARNNLGNLLTASGRPKLAEAEHRRALEIRVGRLGGDHPMVAFSHHNLGEALAAQGRTAEARASLEQALALRERTIGAEHPETDRSRTALEELGNGKLRGGDEGVDLGEP